MLENMRMSSPISSVGRRIPRQARSEQRVADLKAAAAAIIAEVGYEAATLTAIAARAGASIGSLYQYFPDKASVARALAEQYGREASERWESLADLSEVLSLDDLVDRMCDIVLGFLRDRPAFVPLLIAASGYRHPQAERSRLRGHISALLCAHQPDLSGPDALRIADVIVEILKGFSALFAGKPDNEQGRIRDEFRILLRSYLAARLRASKSDVTIGGKQTSGIPYAVS